MTGISRTSAALAAAWIMLLAGTASPSRSQPAALPSAAGAWIRADSVGVYAGKNLFLLVDGGAELFFEYGFVQVLASEYSCPPGASATTELYEMETPAAAYGIFTSFTAGTGTSIPIAQEAVLGEGYCIFWSGPYVGMLTAASAYSGAQRMLVELAGELAKNIRHAGSLPPLCTLLRRSGMEARTMVYVRGKLARANHLPNAWAAFLPPAEGVVGKSGASSYMILEYADAAHADTALRAAALEWQRLQLPAARDSGGKWTIQERDGGVAKLERQGRYILAVAGGREESEILSSRLTRILAGS